MTRDNGNSCKDLKTAYKCIPHVQEIWIRWWEKWKIWKKETQIEYLQMRNTVSEMRKKTLDGIISRLETTEENIS